MSQAIDLDSWTNSLRVWPNPPEGWISWYNRVAKTRQGTWETLGIATALSVFVTSRER